MEIRFATKDDLELLTEAEAECFPVQERAGREAIADRLNIFPDHYLLLFEGKELVAYINGAATAERNLADEMFSAASCHSKNGYSGLALKSTSAERDMPQNCCVNLPSLPRGGKSWGLCSPVSRGLWRSIQNSDIATRACAPPPTAGRFGTRCGWNFEYEKM